MPKPEASSQMPAPTTAVVIAGAVARGAYEAAVMAELLPRVLPTLNDVIFIGTSAGAINAALWAGLAKPGLSVAQVGQKVLEVWSSIDDTKIFGFPLSSLAHAALGGQLINRRGPTNLLDTTPLGNTIAYHFKRLDIQGNIEAGSVAGAAVAATRCGDSVASSRSEVFCQVGVPIPATNPDSSIDLVATKLTPAHVRASSAVPCLFPPEQISGNWYVDGGVRLNTPIAPALAFGVKRVIVISSHTASYVRPKPFHSAPRISDSIAMILHTVLVDGMIEDLRALHRTNQMVQSAPATALPKKHNRGNYEKIEYMVVSPPAGALAREARSALDSALALAWHGKGSLLDRADNVRRALRYKALDQLLHVAGDDSGSDELLSYLLFDPLYFQAQFQQGQRDANDPKVRWTY